MEVCLQYHTRGQQGIQGQTGGQGPEGFAGSKGQKGERAVSGLRRLGPPGPTTGIGWCTPGGGGPHVLALLEHSYCMHEGQLELILNKMDLCLLEQPKYSTQWRIQGGLLGSYKLPLGFFYK